MIVFKRFGFGQGFSTVNSEALFKRRLIAVPNSIDGINSIVAQLAFKLCATIEPNSIHKLQIH